MIAMQYRFTLPADYDMSIIERRIRDKGPLLDRFPGLGFKAYLYAVADDTATGGRENLYAPFYVWENHEGLSDFLCGPPFVAVTEAFGWPQVKTWVVWHAGIGVDPRQARFATREITAITPYSDLAALRRQETDRAKEEIAGVGGPLASVAGFEPTTWTLMRFRLWAFPPPLDVRVGAETYRVGHVSLAGSRQCHGDKVIVSSMQRAL